MPIFKAFYTLSTKPPLHATCAQQNPPILFILGACALLICPQALCLGLLETSPLPKTHSAGQTPCPPRHGRKPVHRPRSVGESLGFHVHTYLTSIRIQNRTLSCFPQKYLLRPSICEFSRLFLKIKGHKMSPCETPALLPVN